MKRRTFCLAAGGGLLTLGGCLNSRDGREQDIGIEIQPMAYMAGAVQPNRVVDGEDIRPEAEIPSVLRDALYEALDGGYQTDAVSEELLAAIDEVRDPVHFHRPEQTYVRLDGTAYVFEANVPTLVVRLSDEKVRDYDPDDVYGGDEELPSAANGLYQTLRYNGPEAPRLPYWTSSVPESIEEFLEKYDYIEDSQGVSRIETERRHWNPPHTIEIWEVTQEERYGREIVDENELGTDLREFLLDVVESGRTRSSPPFVTDTVPGEYFETLHETGSFRDDPFVRLNETVYYIGVVEASIEDAPVEVTTAPASPTDDGLNRFSLTVEATADGSEAEVSSDGTVELFSRIGLPSALWVTHDGEQLLLNSESYQYPVETEATTRTSATSALVLQVARSDFQLLAAEEERDAAVWSLDVDMEEIRDTTVREELPVGDELSATYVIPDALPRKTYHTEGFFGVRWADDQTGRQPREGLYPFRVTITLDNS